MAVRMFRHWRIANLIVSSPPDRPGFFPLPNSAGLLSKTGRIPPALVQRRLRLSRHRSGNIHVFGGDVFHSACLDLFITDANSTTSEGASAVFEHPGKVNVLGEPDPCAALIEP